MNIMKKIIIIDDDKNMCHILSKLLENEGYRTESAFSGNEALQMLMRKHYDFMVVDYQLPDISGLDVLKQTVKYNLMIGKIMISGYGNEQIRSKAERYDALFFDKPFNNEQLVNTIKAYITHTN
jgi:DNA-binding NtrC family response regulator